MNTETLKASTVKKEILESTREVRCDNEGRLEVIVTNTDKELVVNVTYKNDRTYILDTLMVVLLLILLWRLPDIVNIINWIRYVK
jgi:hypothetical protein